MMTMDDFYPIFLVNIKEKKVAAYLCDTPAERDFVEAAAYGMAEIFGVEEDFCVKFVMPEFAEDEE